MQKNPEIIKLLAQKTRTSPEWTGPSGVFMNPFSGYAGVKIFVGYVKHLKLANGNKIPDTLPRKANDYLDYLNELPEDKKEEYSTYFQKTVPKIYNMIRDAKMTKESILEFANIFNELGIGQNPTTIIADYQSAISDALKFKMQTVGGAGQDQDQILGQTETYQQLALSEKEKAEVVEKCHQKGVMISANQLDDYYVGSSSGDLYFGDGTAVTSSAVGLALTQTLQYQVGIGNAQRLALTVTEIAGILEVCKIKGIKFTKEDLENIYIDKDGQLYSGDGTMITDVALGTAIKQTSTYIDAYQKFAGKRGEKQVAKEIKNQEELIPGRIAKGGVLGSSRILEGTEAARRAGSLARGQTSASQTSQTISPTSGEMFLAQPKDMSLSGGLGMPKNGLVMPPGWSFKGRGKYRERTPGQRTRQRRMPQEGQSQQASGSGMPNAGQPERRISDGGGMGNSPAAQPKGSNKLKWGAGAAAALGGGAVINTTVHSATFFIMTNIPDNHSFISNILKIIFP